MIKPMVPLVAIFLIASPSGNVAAQAQGTTGADTTIAPRPQAPGPSDVAVKDLFRYEPTGLSLLRPHARGKIPIVFVHGLWSNPWSWGRMIESLEADPALGERYQFWTFGYSTGDPIPHSAWLLRHDLEEARRRFDPDQSDPAFARMVIVGHSMGGLLAKMVIVDSGDRLWRAVSDRPFHDLAGDPTDREILRRALFLEPRAEIRRAVFIATPHQGSRVDFGSIHGLGTRLVRLPDPLHAVHRRLIEGNDREFFNGYFRKGLPTSIDQLEWRSPFLVGLHDLAVSPAVKAHSIIAVRPGKSPLGQTDGLVTYESAHIAGASSEKIVSAGHHCQDHPEVVGEIRRILAEHGAP